MPIQRHRRRLFLIEEGVFIFEEVPFPKRKKARNKVAILALDGLDYSLLRKFDLENLLQERSNTHIVNVGHAASVIWASFITGRTPSFHGVTDRKCEGEKQRNVRIRKGLPTIFDLPRNSVALWIPSLNPHPLYWEPHHMELMMKGLSDSSFLRLYEEEILELFDSQKAECLEKLGNEWELFMAHFNFSDALSHVYFGHLTKMWEIYGLLDDFVRNVRRRLDKKDILLIVSDHGFLWTNGFGDHYYENAFYSVNKNFDFRCPEITDWFEIIRFLLFGLPYG